MGDIEKAHEYSLKSIRIIEKFFSPDHFEMGAYYNNLATIYQDMGKLDKALEYALEL